MKTKQPETAQQTWLEYSTMPSMMIPSVTKQIFFTPCSKNICDLCTHQHTPINLAPCLQCSHYKD